MSFTKGKKISVRAHRRSLPSLVAHSCACVACLPSAPPSACIHLPSFRCSVLDAAMSKSETSFCSRPHMLPCVVQESCQRALQSLQLQPPSQRQQVQSYMRTRVCRLHICDTHLTTKFKMQQSKLRIKQPNVLLKSAAMMMTRAHRLQSVRSGSTEVSSKCSSHRSCHECSTTLRLGAQL